MAVLIERMGNLMRGLGKREEVDVLGERRAHIEYLTGKALGERHNMIVNLFTDDKDDPQGPSSVRFQFEVGNPTYELPQYMAAFAEGLNISGFGKTELQQLKNDNRVFLGSEGWLIVCDVGTRQKDGMSGVTITIQPVPQPGDYDEVIKSMLAAKRSLNNLEKS